MSMGLPILIAKVNGIEMAYHRWGEGHYWRIMLVAGWSCVKELWADFASKLSERDFDVVAMDLRGSGDSSIPAGDYGLEVHSGDLHAFVRELGWDNGFILLGNSMGGAIVLDYALRYPETLTHIIPSNIGIVRPTILTRIAWGVMLRTYKKDPKKMLTKLIRMWFKFPLSQEKLDWFLELSLKTDTRAGINEIQHSYRWNFEHKLHLIKVPTLVISSEFDSKLLRPATRRIHRLIQNSEMGVILKTGHLPFIENPEGYIQAIVDFVQKENVKGI